MADAVSFEGLLMAVLRVVVELVKVVEVSEFLLVVVPVAEAELVSL